VIIPQRWLGLVALIAVITLSSGCGGSQSTGKYELHPVKGQVLYNGQPLSGATVVFSPEDDKKPGAYGRTDEQGQFTLTTHKHGVGAVAGSFEVGINKSAGGDGEEITDPEKGAKIKPSSAIPQKYANPKTSGKTAVVKAGETNEFTFKLD